MNLYVDDVFAASDTGELQLTNYGISGIPVFQISRYAAKALYEKKQVTASIDFLPTMTEEELNEFIQKRRQSQSYKTAEDFFVGMFHKKLIGMFLKIARISLNQAVETILPKQWKQLLALFKYFKVEIEGTNSFDQAQVCAGGVRTTEINPETMESLYVDGLYLTGELLDIDGICGGYNLQWAWATGYIAGKNAAKTMAKGMYYASHWTIKIKSKSYPK